MDQSQGAFYGDTAPFLFVKTNLWNATGQEGNGYGGWNQICLVGTKLSTAQSLSRVIL